MRAGELHASESGEAERLDCSAPEKVQALHVAEVLPASSKNLSSALAFVGCQSSACCRRTASDELFFVSTATSVGAAAPVVS